MANIIFIANFISTETVNNRFINLALLFQEKGRYNVEVITSDFCHGTKKNKDFTSPSYDFKITRIHEPGYTSNVSPKRLYSHYCWGKNVFRYIKNLKERPDVVYCAIPSLTAAKLVGEYCNKNNIEFICDIQDLWPEAFELLLKNKNFSNLIFKPFHYYANKAYKNSNLVIGVSNTYVNRAISGNKGLVQKPCLVTYLGNDLDLFDNSKNSIKIDKPDKEFWITYIGTLGFSYDIKCVISALKIVKEKYNLENIKFNILGEGPHKREFQKFAEGMGVNTWFAGSLPYNEMVAYLVKSDIVVNPIKEGGAQSITNKVGDYAFAGVPIINNQPNVEYRALIEEFNCGINCRTGDANQMADAIYSLYSSPKMRVTMGKNGRKLGEERFDRNKTYPLIVQAIKKILKS